MSIGFVMNFWAFSVDEFETETLLGDENLSGAPNFMEFTSRNPTGSC